MPLMTSSAMPTASAEPSQPPNEDNRSTPMPQPTASAIDENRENPAIQADALATSTVAHPQTMYLCVSQRLSAPSHPFTTTQTQTQTLWTAPSCRCSWPASTEGRDRRNSCPKRQSGQQWRSPIEPRSSPQSHTQTRIRHPTTRCCKPSCFNRNAVWL